MGLWSQAGSHLRAVASNNTASITRPRGTSVDDRAPEDTEPDDTSILFVLPQHTYPDNGLRSSLFRI
jgi:hypothetical protein